MKRSILTSALILAALLFSLVSYGTPYSAELSQIDTLISQKMNRDAIDLSRDLYRRAATDGDRLTQMLALKKGVSTELTLDYSAKDGLLDSLLNMRSEFRGDELSLALVNSIACDLSMFIYRDKRAKEIRSEIIEATLGQREALSKLSAEPYSQFTTLQEYSDMPSPNLYIALLRKYVGVNSMMGSAKLTKRLYEELISLPEMSDELQVVVKSEYIKFMREDVTAKLKELEQEYSHCDATPIISAYLIEREINAERYKEEQDYERIDKICREVKERYPNSKYLYLINNITASLHAPSGEIEFPKQIYPNLETNVDIKVRNVERLTVELYRLTGEPSQQETMAGVEIYNKNRRQLVDSLSRLSELLHTQRLSLKARLKQELKSVVPIKIKEYGRYLVVVRDSDGAVLSGEVTTVSRIGAETWMTSENLSAYVVDFNTGEPIKKASFDLYVGDKYLYTRRLESEDGLYTIASRSDLKSNTRYKIKIDDGAGDVLSITNSNYNHARKSFSKEYSIACYTDRMTYRPGDTVQVHTVLYAPSRELIEGVHICNRLDTASGRIIDYDHVETDAWGGASSSFVIPKDVVSGRYRIYAFSNSKDANNYQRADVGQKYIQIESYTQPTSEITLEQERPIYFPEDSVKLRGLVTGYDGRSMEGVEVVCEVKRRVRYSYDEYETILKKSVTTDSNGEYTIEFVAEESDYQIAARMVDKNGETREVNRWLGIEKSPYELECLSGYEMPRSLKKPLSFSRNLGSDEPLSWSYTITKEGDKKPLLSGEFQDDEPLIVPYDKLSDGAYRISWSSAQGVGVDGASRFLIYTDSQSATPVGEDVLFLDAPQKSVAAGSDLRYIVSTTEREIYALVTLSRGDSLLHSEVKRLTRGTHELTTQYSSEVSHDLLLCVSTVKHGKRYQKYNTFDIVKPSEKIEVTIEDLPTELRASTTNELRVEVFESDTKRGVPSKLIVSIYDKASDIFCENTLPALKSKRYMWGYISRSVEPYSLRSLWLDFSHGESNIQIRGVANFADFTEDNMVSVGYGTSKKREVTGSEERQKVRDNFTQTALFSGEILTDESGEAVIPFTLSDLLTTYKVKVVAVARDARSATTESEFVATKKVMVSTLLPQFIRVGDMLKINSLAINRRDCSIDAVVKMELFDMRTKTIFNKGLRSVELAPNSTQSLEWEITAPDYVDELGVKISLESEHDNDIEQHTLRVDPAVERVRIGALKYFDENFSSTFIRPHEMLQDGAFNEEMTLSYQAIIPAMISTIAAQRESEPTTAIDFANRIYVTQATHKLAMRYKSSVLESFKNKERANVPSNKRWIDNLLEMRDHSKAHKEIMVNRLRLDEFRCSDGGYSWLKGGESSLMVTLYVARMQLGEIAIKCNSYTSNDLTKALEQTMKYLDKVMAQDSTTLSRTTLEYLELRSRQIVNHEPPTAAWSSYLELIEREWRELNTYQMAQAALVLRRSGRDCSEIIEIIKQQAVRYPQTGVTFPSGYADNFASIVEGNIAAHTLIMTLFSSATESHAMVRDMFKWLMMQRKNQMWVNSATTLEVVSAMYEIYNSKIFNGQNAYYIGYPQNMVKSRVFTTSTLDIDIVREGRPINVKRVKSDSSRGKAPAFVSLDYSYDVSLKEITANSSGFTITRELLTSYYPKIGDIVRVRYTIKSDQNINLVKLRTMKCGAYEPRDLKSGYKNGYYREVRSDGIDYYIDLLERGTTTIEEEFMVWYGGSFVDGYAAIESVMNPHLSGNTATERIEIE